MTSTLFVYAAAAAAALLAARRLARISGFAALALAFLPLVLTGSAVFSGGYYGPIEIAYQRAPLAAQTRLLPPGDYFRILSDVQVLNVPWAKAVRESVKHGRLPFLNRFESSGDILLAVFQPMVFHPATLIGFLLPLARAWTFACAFHFFLAALCAFLYLREIDLGEPAAFFGAAVWMLSNFLVFWVGWDIAPAFAPFPLLLLGLRRLARGIPGGFSVSAAALLLALLAGHPETVLHEVAAGGIFFLADLRRSGVRARAIAGAVGAGAMAIALAAPALFPFLEALPQSWESITRRVIYAHERKSVSVPDAGTAALFAIDPDRAGPRWRPTLPAPRTAPDGVAAGVGALALALAAVGLTSRRKEKGLLAGVGALCFLAGIGFPGIADALGRLPLFDIALNGRLTGIAAFCAAALAAFGFEECVRAPGLRVLRVFAGAAAVVAAAGVFAPKGAPHAGEILLGLGSIAAAAGLAAAAGRMRRFVPAALIGLFLAVRLADLPRLYPTFSDRFFYPPIPEFAALPADGEPYRVVGFNHVLTPNQAALYELEDPRGYSSMTNMRYVHLFPLWSVPQPVFFNRVDDPTTPFLAYLNVRYLITAPADRRFPGWREAANGIHCRVLENPNVLPRAFAPARLRFHGPLDDPLPAMRAVRDFREIGWVEDAARAGAEEKNGSARVVTRRRGADLLLDVDAEAPAWVLVSQTFWKGWTAEIDGVPAPLRYGNLAFLAIRSPAGRHRIALRYRPASFRLGLAVFAAALLIVGAAAIRRRRAGVRDFDGGAVA